MSRTITTTAWLVIEPTWERGQVTAAKATRLTLSAPKGGGVGAIAVKLTIELPETAFKPAEIEAVITAGEQHVTSIQVTPETLVED